MSRLILRFRGAGPMPAEDVERIRASSHVILLDDSSPRMILVEAPEAEVKSLVEKMPNWVMAPERTVPLPDPRPKVRRAGRHSR